GERAGADADTIGIFGAVAHDVVAHVAARRLDPHVNLARRRLELARDLRDRRPLGNHFQALTHDFAALLELLDAHPVSVVAVAERPLLAVTDGHFEFEPGINGLRNIPADVPFDAGRPEIRPYEVVLERVFLGNNGDVREPFDVNL